MTGHNELLVTGFIREIDNLLSHQIVPDSIYTLCYLYQKRPIDRIIFRIHDRSKSVHIDSNGKSITSMDSLCIIKMIDPDTQKIFTIKREKIHKNEEIHHMIHIENISNLLPTEMTHNNNNLNGIFGVANTPYYQKRSAYLILYNPAHRDDNGIIQALYEYQSNNTFKKSGQMLKCSDQYVIYENDGSFYKMNWKDIKHQQDFGFFKEIPQQKLGDLQTRLKNTSFVRCSGYFTMLYITDRNLIFCYYQVTGYGGRRSFRNNRNAKPKVYSATINCGLFDIENGQWIDIPPYEYKYETISYATNLQYKMAYDVKRKFIYISGGKMNNVCIYDLEKNEWRSGFVSKRGVIGDSVMWINEMDDTLNVIGKRYKNKKTISKSLFGGVRGSDLAYFKRSISLSERKKEWKISKEAIVGLSDWIYW